MAAERSPRAVKEVDRLSVDEAPTQHELVIPEGSGVELGSIAMVAYSLKNMKADHDLLKALHHLLFGTFGQEAHRKKDIRAFKGWEEGDDQKEKRMERLSSSKHWKVDNLKDLCTMLGLHKTGKTLDLVGRVVDFLYKPHVTELGGKTPVHKKAAAAGAGKGEKRKAEGGAKKAAGAKDTKKKAKKEGPKRATTAFFVFSAAKREEVKAANPDFKVTDISKELGAQWKALTDAQKAPYVAEADKDKARYEKELAAWKAKGN